MTVFMRVEDAAALLSATRRLNETGRFVWIASDGWGKEELPVLGDNEVAAEGALTIELQTTPLPEFDTYFRQLRPSTNHRNPWFREYWERAHDCTFDVNTNVDERRRNSTVLTYTVCNIALYLLRDCYLSRNTEDHINYMSNMNTDAVLTFLGFRRRRPMQQFSYLLTHSLT